MPAYKDTKQNTWLIKFKYKTWDKKTKWVTKRGFETKKEALTWEYECKSKLSGKSDMNLNVFSDLYLKNLEVRLKPDTFASKKAMIDKWILPYLGNHNLVELSTQDVMLWQNTIMAHETKTGNKLSKSYIKTLHNQLSAMLNHAVKYYGLTKNPAAIVGNCGTDKEVKNSFWTKDEFNKFAEAIMDEPEYYYFFEIQYWCGLREGEALALTLKDIDFTNKTININKTYYVLNGKEYVTTPKSQESIRTVTVPDFLIKDLKDYIDMIYEPEEDQRIFQLSKSGLHRAIRRGAKKANIPVIRIHDLRHSHVSLLINMGFTAPVIGKRVGHSSAYITFHYAHMFPNAQEDLADKLNELNKENLENE